MPISQNFSRPRTYDFRNSAYSISDYGDIEDGTIPTNEKSIQTSHLYRTDSEESFKSMSKYKSDGYNFYKPTSNKTWVLCMFLVLIAFYITLIELAVATHGGTQGVISIRTRDLTSIEAVSGLLRRDNADGSSVVLSVASTSAVGSDTTPSTQSISASSTDPPQITSSTSQSFTASTTVGQPPPNSQVTVMSSSTSQSELTGAPNPNSQVSVTSQPNPVSQVTVTSQPVISTPTTIISQSTSEPGTTVGQPNQGSQVSVTSQESSTLQVSSTSIASNSVAVSSEKASVSSTAGKPTMTSTSSKEVIPESSSSSIIVVLTTTNAKGSTIVTSSTTIRAPSSIALISSSASRTDLISTTSSSQASKPTTSATENGVVTGLASDSQSKPLTQFDYFCAIYLPTLLALVLQSAWLIVYSSLKAMEPFYQLAQPGGAPAASTLTADYLSCGISFTFIKTALDGHWVMCLAGVVQLLIVIIVSFSSRIFDIVPTEYCKTKISDHQPCNPVWIVEFKSTRAVEVMLVLCFSLIVSLTYLNRNRISGVYSDPTRIATIADLLTHKPLIQEIRDLPPNATKQQIEFDLAESRYLLGTFEMHGQDQYGIIKLNMMPRSEFGRRPWLAVTFEHISRWVESAYDKTCKDLPMLPDFISMALTASLFSIILAYFLIPGTDQRSFNKFMNSGNFWPSFLLTIHGVLLNTFVQRKERLLRLSHPYVLLSQSPSKPATQTITAGIHETSYVSIWKSFLHGDFMLASLSLAVFFSEMIIFLVPGIPWTVSQTAPIYKASTFTCLGLLFLVFIVQVNVVYDEWQRRDMLQHDLPDTVASVMQRLCASHFVEEKNTHLGGEGSDVYTSDADMRNRSGGFRDIVTGYDEEVEDKQRMRYEGSNYERRYRFAYMEGVDGVHRFMVDEDLSGR